MQLSIDSKPVYIYTGGKPFNSALPTLVFIHGAAHDHSVWLLQSRYFVHHAFNVLAVDLPGHGRSGGPPLNKIEEMAEWIIRILDVVGLPQAMLIGHSMGSLIALEAAAHSRQRVSRLVLLGCAIPMTVSEALLETAQHDETRAQQMINIWSYSTGALFGSNIPGIWIMGANQRLMERARKGVLYVDLSACNAYSDGMAAAMKIACPTLLIKAQRDLMTPNIKQLVEALPNTKIVSLPHCGHAMMAEEPSAVLEALRDFIAP